MFLFCCTLLFVHSNIAIILMGKRELVALLNLSSWCLVMVGWPFLAVPWGCPWFVIVVFPDQTHLLFLTKSIDANMTKMLKYLFYLKIYNIYFCKGICSTYQIEWFKQLQTVSGNLIF